MQAQSVLVNNIQKIVVFNKIYKKHKVFYLIIYKIYSLQETKIYKFNKNMFIMMILLKLAELNLLKKKLI